MNVANKVDESTLLTYHSYRPELHLERQLEPGRCYIRPAGERDGPHLK